MKSWKKLLGGFMAASMLVTALPTVAFGGTKEGQSEADEEGYRLVFSDEFEGSSLDRDVWNVETHEAGWVNEELQEYVDSTDNVYLQDGNLVIMPNKDESGKVTSGRISTQNKKTFTYGKFEVRAKVPQGNGYLPAFWLMANDENVYGQWPRCGEIDCMEVMGSNTSEAFGTIHFGNPHAERQGTYSAEGVDFSEDFHTFTCEWEPGKITWFVDGNKFYTTSDWYSVTENQGELTYPAPFDQPFYIILNLAVGGSWVGYPDDDQVIDQPYVIDYVRVYQKDSYNENVEKPVKEVNYREADENGNYIHNGDFSVAESLSDDVDWKFLTAGGGAGTATITNGEMLIQTTDAGNVDYGIQLVQPELPMYKGATYRVSYDAYAASDRTMIVDISGPDVNYVRYMKDTKVELTTTNKSFTHEFVMNDKTDANGRLEFNMGKVDNASDIHISNVKVEKIADGDPSIINAKTPRADGNLIYNGKFQEGTAHLGDWEVTIKNNDSSIANAAVTGFDDGRRLEVKVTDASTDVTDVVLTQKDLPVTPNTLYAFSFEAQSDREKEVTVNICGTTKSFQIGTEKKSYSVSLPAQATYENKNLVMNLGTEGTIYLDNIRLVEDTMIKNGSFDAGTAGYEIYIDSSASADYVVDSLEEDNALSVTVRDTSNEDWKVQIKQNEVPLVEGQWYKLSFRAKSTLDRQIRVIMQGKEDKGWDVYSGDGFFDVTSEFQTYNVKFQMTKETDLHAFLSICLGKVDREIAQLHRVVIDDISLVEIDAPLPEGANLLQNADFANGMDNWSEIIANWGPDYETEAYSEIVEDGIKYVITNPGTEDWHVQLKQSGLKLEDGKTYRLKFNAVSTVARTIKPCFMSTTYAWYGGDTFALEANVVTPITLEITMTTDDDAADFLVSLGQLGNTPASTVTLTDFTLIEVTEDAPSKDDDKPQTPEKQPVADGTNLIGNADFAESFDSWEKIISTADGADADITAIDGGVKFDIRNPGTADWHVQMKQHGIYLEDGKTYKISFVATTTVNRLIKVGFMSTSYNWYGGGTFALEAGKDNVIDAVFKMNTADANADFFISLGDVVEESPIALLAMNNTPASVVTIKNIAVVSVDPDAESGNDTNKGNEDDSDKDDSNKDDSNKDDSNKDDSKNDSKGDKEENGTSSKPQNNKMGDTPALPLAICIVLFGITFISLALLRRKVRK